MAKGSAKIGAEHQTEAFKAAQEEMQKEAEQFNDQEIKDKEDKEETETGIRKYLHERKSKKTVWGMPLWHVAKNARGFLAVGLNAKGVIAVGSVYERLGSLTTENRAAVKEALDTVVPTYLAWAKELIKAFL